MIQCQECGHDNNDQGIFCKKCYIKLKKAINPQVLSKKEEDASLMIDKKIKGSEFLD